jgi:dolichol-phosphate mannosyltransferase
MDAVNCDTLDVTHLTDRDRGSPPPDGRAEVGSPQALDLSIIVPVYNEVESLPGLHAEILAMLAGRAFDAEIIYVDDCSRDGSWELLESMVAAAAHGAVEVRTLRLRRNFGQTAAMAAGFQASRGRVVVPMDGDGQNNPADVIRLMERLDDGYDVVSGWRKNRQDKAISRKIPSMVANRLIGRISGVVLNDYGCTLKAYRGSMLRELRLYGEMHRFIPLYLARIGARVTELPVDHRARAHGESKYGSRRIFKVFLDLFLIRFMTRYSSRPMHFFGKTALLFLVALGVTCAAMVSFKFGWLRSVGIDYQASFVETPLPALAGTFLVGATLSVFVGIVAELLVRILYESQGAVPYVVATQHSSASHRTGRR